MLGILGILGWWLCCLGWIATTDWVGRDSTRYRFAPRVWVPVCVGVFLVAALAAWWIPSGIAVALLLPLAWLVPAIVYVVTRNQSLPVGKQVLTANHIRNVASRLGKRVRVKIDPGLEDDEPPMPDVEIHPVPKAADAAPAGKDKPGGQAKPAAAKEKPAGSERQLLVAMPGHRAARDIMTGAVLARAARALIEPAADGVRVRYEVDTVWQEQRRRVPPSKRGERDRYPPAPPLRQDEGTAAMAVLRAAAGLSADGRGSQGGEFVLSVDGKRQTCRVGHAAGSANRLEVEFSLVPPKLKTIADLGVPEPMIEQIRGALKLEKGLLLVSGPAGSGLTMTIDMVVLAADRLMRDFFSIEDEAAPAREIQNVKVQRFDRKSVQPVDALAAAMREYPQGIITRDIRDKPLLLELVRLAEESQLVIVSLKANDAIDAIARLMLSGVPTDVLARVLVGSLSGRLVRRLCPRCRESGPPAADLLRRMRRRPEQVPGIWRAAAEGCSLCQGAGYLGRTGIFEFATGTGVRRGVAANGTPPVLRELAMKDGMVSFEAAGFAAAVAGATSMEEVERVLAATAPPKAVKGGAAS
jgi:general secretion pathway protein E